MDCARRLRIVLTGSDVAVSSGIIADRFALKMLFARTNRSGMMTQAPFNRRTKNAVLTDNDRKTALAEVPLKPSCGLSKRSDFSPTLAGGRHLVAAQESLILRKPAGGARADDCWRLSRHMDVGLVAQTSRQLI